MSAAFSRVARPAYALTFRTRHGDKVHALDGPGTVCDLYERKNDSLLAPDLEVTCKKCLRRLAQGKRRNVVSISSVFTDEESRKLSMRLSGWVVLDDDGRPINVRAYLDTEGEA